MLNNIKNALLSFTIEELEEFYILMYNYPSINYTKQDYTKHILAYFQQDLIDRKSKYLSEESRKTRTIKSYVTISWFTQKCDDR